MSAPTPGHHNLYSFTHAELLACLQSMSQLTSCQLHDSASVIKHLCNTCGCRTETGFFCNTFFNQTVDVVDQPRYIDTQLVFLGFIGLGVLAVIGESCRSNKGSVQDHTGFGGHVSMRFSLSTWPCTLHWLLFSGLYSDVTSGIRCL